MTTTQPRKWSHALTVAAVLAAGMLAAAVIGGWFRTNSSPKTAPAAALPPTIEGNVTALQAAAGRNPNDPQVWQQLTHVYVQQAIQSSDPTFYQRAQAALDNASRIAPDDPQTWRAAATLAVSLHHFSDAASLATRVLVIDPYDSQMSAIIVDANTELGRYTQAAEQLQQLLDHKPGSAALTRVSYQRELRGDIAGALTAMDEAAAAAAGGTAFDRATIDTYRGDLLWNAGRIEQAGHSYKQALNLVPGHGPAIIGLARVEAAQGQRTTAIQRLQQLVERVPLPAAATLLGEIQQADGRQLDATASFDLVDTIAKLQAANGVAVDLDIALFQADHTTVTSDTVDRARRLYANRPSIYAADALAWTLHRAGQNTDAIPLIEDALRLGTGDAQLHFHAAVIFNAVGNTTRATTELTKAAAANTWFSIPLRTDAITLATQLGITWQ